MSGEFRFLTVAHAHKAYADLVAAAPNQPGGIASDWSDRWIMWQPSQTSFLDGQALVIAGNGGSRARQAVEIAGRV